MFSLLKPRETLANAATFSAAAGDALYYLFAIPCLHRQLRPSYYRRASAKIGMTPAS